MEQKQENTDINHLITPNSNSQQKKQLVTKKSEDLKEKSVISEKMLEIVRSNSPKRHLQKKMNPTHEKRSNPMKIPEEKKVI